MSEFGVLGYSAAALAFLVLSILLLTSWRGRLQGGLLLLATSTTVLWAAALAAQAAYHAIPVSLIWMAEVLRNFTWLIFLVKLAGPPAGQDGAFVKVLRFVRLLIILVCILLLVPFDDLLLFQAAWSSLDVGLDLRFLGQVLLALCGVALLEQLYRNAPPEHKWGIKYLCLGLGGMFAYDFYLFSDALLFRRIDGDLWHARGAVNMLIVPMVAVAAARNPQWSLDLFVSRRMVFHTASFFAAGIYMLLMALAGYYIKLYGGQWGTVLQVTFLFAAGLLLVSIFFSGYLRSRIKVFLSKHFFSYRYDYREEWLRLIGILSGREMDMPLQERVISALAGIVESPGGLLWLRDEKGAYDNTAHWNLPEVGLEANTGLESLLAFLKRQQWVVNLEEYAEDPDFYEGLELPGWLLNIEHAWLVVPLIHDMELQGFVVLATPRVRQTLNWENMDLLKTAGCQAASYLALNQAAQALAEARQFEGFNRLSAFVIHDLKNLIAQLSLVTKNAARHKHNPEFIDDAMRTIENSVAKMNRLMMQMRSAMPGENRSRIELNGMLRSLVAERSGQKPAPTFRPASDEILIYADRDRMGAVFGHIIQNAQDATPAGGSVEVGLRAEAEQAIVEVRDTGSGMDETFIRERLFRPFDSTKGLTGMGIGAYECRDFVHSIGGRVSVSSTPGAGTVFTILLPLAFRTTIDEQKEIH
ncbi:MAG TPA: PEP-CTERM system histidine kinase PrsK [Sedimenticola sp.]|nr:PEP-CTERM system histidine kinase PrsK [Sedimenticola sp.]